MERHARAIAVAAVLLASARIVATYTVFSQTSDEPVHIACGMEWLDKARYTGEAQHPPLARVAAAIGPYLLGAHSQWKAHADSSVLPLEGTRILAAGGRPDLALTVARAGILPFFWIACWVVYEWGRRYFGRGVAAIAVAIFTFTPTVLAHAGLATTDMALTAFLGAAFLTLLVLLEQPTARWTVALGLCSGLAILSKFSSLVFFPAAVLASLIWYLARQRPSLKGLVRRVQRFGKPLALSALICCLVIWAGYRFSIGKVYFANLILPAPEFYLGVQAVIAHNAAGNICFLLGQTGRTGWWYFFPVVLAVKTPLAFLMLLGFWTWLVVRKRLAFDRWWLPLTFSAAILIGGMMSRIDMGLRHILPVYIGFSLMAAAGFFRMLERASERRWLTWALVVLCGWFAGSSLMVHPDYLAYFNELAGGHPERIEADSDLDWGQDFKRLAKRLKEVGADRVTLVTRYVQNFEQLGIRYSDSSKFDLLHPPSGWTAISISDWKLNRFGLYDRYPNAPLWPDVIPPTERVGRGMLLWYVPPAPKLK